MMMITDEELARELGIADDPRWPEAISRLTPQKRSAYEDLVIVSREMQLWELGLGPRPQGVLIDTDRVRK